MTGYPNQSPEARAGEAQDPGAVDNRLSLDPNDPNWKETISDWEDGEDYTVTVTMRQISPGEYEVTGLTSESEGAGESDSADEETEPEPKMKPGVRRGVSKMMQMEGA